MDGYRSKINYLQDKAEHEIIEFLKKNSPDEAYEVTSYSETGLFAPGYEPYISKIRVIQDPVFRSNTDGLLCVLWQTDKDEADEGVYNKETHSFEEFEQGDWTCDIPMYNIFDIADKLKNK